MRRPLDAERIRRFMRDLGEEAERDVRLYFTGGATAVLLGWRAGTIDVDVKLEPETDRLFRALPRIKDKSFRISSRRSLAVSSGMRRNSTMACCARLRCSAWARYARAS